MPQKTGNGFRCPTCQGDTSVLETRRRSGGLRRRRQCSGCQAKFTTIEMVAPMAGLRVTHDQDLAILSSRDLRALRRLMERLVRQELGGAARIDPSTT